MRPAPSRIRRWHLWSGVLCVLLIAAASREAHADTIFGADLSVTYWDTGAGTTPPTFRDSYQTGGAEDSLIHSWEPKPVGWEGHYDTANIVDGLSLHSINDVFNDLMPVDQSHIPTPLFSVGPGEDLSLAIQLESALSFAAENVDGGLFDYFGTADVSNTATILGVAVFDPDMSPMPDATVFFQRGLAYPIVPEPSSLLLLGAGLLTGLRLARRRSRG